ncbi:putative RDD family membrane protein YckC [Streptomyces sp. SAI-117]|uniref:RDD family protein n=1 Tax=Streptomyces sp. SAI-117 TaxID=2940546 RepID=UPI002476E135|nr:RDD family protein [Streptomyces sp. SAI-117]MDH6570035.1 putative RDD family membrane protein YckC [Streptomyces sp. SAI-117]
MSAPTPAPGDDRPREGYYPDPSIPGYVRYWNGASWVPGTSRPAPAAGEPLAPPAGAGSGSAPSPVEETGPHFFDEDPAEDPPHPDSQHGSRPEPASAWAADRAHQAGFGGDQDRRVSWGSPQAAVQAQQEAPPQGIPQQGPQQGPQGDRRGVPRTPQGADPRVPGPGRPGDGSAPVQPDGQVGRTDGTATIPPAEPDEDGGTRVFRRPTAGSGTAAAAQQSDDGTMKFRALSPRTAQQGEGPGAQHGSTPGPAYSGPTAQGGPGAAAPGPQGPGFAAGKAAAERAAAAGATGPQGGPQQAAVPQSAVPQSAVPQAPVAAQVAATPMSAGPGGGQPSWAQQVHRLAGPDEEQPAPWKPPVEDIFQAAARRQAAARPAGLGKRLAARLLDTLVVGAVTAVAAVPLGAKAADHVNEKIDAAKLSGETVTVWLLDGTTSVYLGIVVAVLLVAGVLYEALPTAKWGRTLGKKLLGLEVRDIEAHEPPPFGAALRRWLVYSVPGLLGIGLVGVAWCLFDRPWHQCWHDKAAHTFVAG